jgi:hypothetical protein
VQAFESSQSFCTYVQYLEEYDPVAVSVVHSFSSSQFSTEEVWLKKLKIEPTGTAEPDPEA